MAVPSETLANITTTRRRRSERVKERRNSLSALKVQEEQVESREGGPRSSTPGWSKGREFLEGVDSGTDSSRNGYDDKSSDGDDEIGSLSDASSEEGVNDNGASASRCDSAVKALFRTSNPAAYNLSSSLDENNMEAEKHEEATSKFDIISTILHNSVETSLGYFKWEIRRLGQANEHAQGQLASQGDDLRHLRFELKMAEAKVGELKEETQGLHNELQVKDDLIVQMKSTNQFLNNEINVLKEKDVASEARLANAKDEHDALKKLLMCYMRYFVVKNEVEP